MDKNLSILQENIKNSFFKVKKHILSLEKEINEIKRRLDEISQKTTISLSSIGNEGVAIRRRQSFDKESAISRQPAVNKPAISLTVPISSQDIEDIKQDLDQKFRALTDKQFSIFMMIYQLEEELNRPVSYIEIAAKTGLSQSVIRDYTSELILKKAPLNKLKQNNKVYLSVPKEFRELSLASKLIKFRQLDLNQTTLFDNFH